MSKRKYTTELMLQIVEEYQQGELGLKLLAEKYCVSKGDIQKWSDAYREHGLNGLCKKYERYSGQFKVDVIEYMHNTCSSARQTAAHFNISSYSLRYSKIAALSSHDSLLVSSISIALL